MSNAKEQIDGDNVIVLDPPIPLRQPLREAEAYPVDSLGPTIEAAVRAAAHIVQAPVEIAAQSALAQVSLAVQAHLDIRLPIAGGDAMPSSLFLLTIAASGDRKSFTDKRFAEAVRIRERELEDERLKQMDEYRDDKAAYEAARKKAKSGKKLRVDIKKALEEVGLAPIAPRDSSLTYSEPTIEGLIKHYTIGQPALGVFSDEGGMLVGGMGMSDENVLRTGGGFSNLWDGKPIRRLRAGDGALALNGRRCAFHIMIQERAAHEWLSTPALRDQGLFGRLLIAAPKSLAGSRVARIENTEQPQAAIDAFTDKLLLVLRRHLPLASETDMELSPVSVDMDPDAKELWVAFANVVESELGEDGRLRPIYSLANKAAEHAARLAVSIAGLDNINMQSLTAANLERGVSLMKWYLGEALRLAEHSQVPDNILHAEILQKWLAEKWLPEHDEKLISLPDICQLGPNKLRSKDVATHAINTLVSHGWLIKLDGYHEIDGSPRRDVFRVRES